MFPSSRNELVIDLLQIQDESLLIISISNNFRCTFLASTLHYITPFPPSANAELVGQMCIKERKRNTQLRHHMKHWHIEEIKNIPSNFIQVKSMHIRYDKNYMHRWL
jgi:hypothetical protein